MTDVSRVQPQRPAAGAGRGVSSAASRRAGGGACRPSSVARSTASSEVHLRGSEQKIVEVLVVGFCSDLLILLYLALLLLCASERARLRGRALRARGPH